MRISDWSSDVCSSDLAGSSHGFLDRVSRRLLLGTDRHHAAVSVESELVVSDKRTEFPREGSHLVLAVESVDPEEQRLGDAISNKRGTHAGRRDGLEDVLDCRLALRRDRHHPLHGIEGQPILASYKRTDLTFEGGDFVLAVEPLNLKK